MVGGENEERRFVLRLLEYWQVVRGDREFPRPEDMNLNDMGKDASSSALVAIGNRPECSIFRFVGLRLRPSGWGDGNGRSVGEIPSKTLLHELFRNYMRITDRPVPMSFGDQFQLHGKLALGRSILLPLSTDGIRITHVMGGINFRFLSVDEAVMEKENL